jgi:hypothetical protein
MPSRSPGPLPPPPLPLDHPPQRLTAGRAAKPLARTPLRGCEVRFAPRTVAAKKSGFLRCALTLAPLRRTLAWGIGHRGVGCLGFGLAATLGAATAVPPALVPAFLLAVGRPPVLSAGSPSPPPTCRRATLGATVPSLRMGGSEESLAPLEQTPPLSRPTSPLTGPRLAASLEWAQGSCELPTAKPRVRSPLRSAPRRIVLSPRPSWSNPHSTVRPIRPASKRQQREPPRRNALISVWHPSRRKSGVLAHRY